MTAILNAAIDALRCLMNAEDAHWLLACVRQRRNFLSGGGIPGSVVRDMPDETIANVRDLIEQLPSDDLDTFRRAVELVHRLLWCCPAGTIDRVELKTMVLTFPQVDPATGGPALDANQQPMVRIAAFQFCYVRQGQRKVSQSRHYWGCESIYADRGMGRGGTGGYVAAALREGVVTETEILDAWRAGDVAYREFIEHCAERVRPSRGIRLSDRGE